MNRTTSRYIYGIIRQLPDASPLPDLGEGIHVVTYNWLGCVLKHMEEEDYLKLGKREIAKNLVSHQTIIEKIMETHTIIPMKFGTFLKEDPEVIEMLDRSENLFVELLDAMDGKIELDVVAYWDDLNAIIKEIGETNKEIQDFKREIAKNTSEDMFQASLQLGTMVKTALDEKRQSLQDEIIDRLKSLPLEHQKHDLMEDKMVLNCAFLISKESEDSFDTVLHELDERHEGAINFRCVGPLPPYSFATCEVKSIHFEEIDKSRRLLGLSEGLFEKDRVTQADIKAAYRNFIKTEHPDAVSSRSGRDKTRKKKTKDSETQKHFEEIRSAYETLLDFCSEGEISFRPEDINGRLIVRRFDVAGTRTFNR